MQLSNMTGKQHTDRRHTENTQSDSTQKRLRHKAHRKNARTGGIYTKKNGRTYRIYARMDGTQKTGTLIKWCPVFIPFQIVSSSIRPNGKLKSNVRNVPLPWKLR